jgi:hypothetical protein
MSATSSINTSATVRAMSHARCGEPSRTLTVKANDSGSALAGVRAAKSGDEVFRVFGVKHGSVESCRVAVYRRQA